LAAISGDGGKWKWLIPTILLAISAAIARFGSPPDPLVEWVGGDETWARLVLAFGLFFSFNMLLAPFGLLRGKINLPFGFGFEQSNASDQEEGKLLAEFVSLRQSNERAFIRIGELSQLIKDTVAKLEDQEARIDDLEQRHLHDKRVRAHPRNRESK
jgi:hypothetical protein